VSESLIIDELPLASIAVGGPMRPEFERVQAPWVRAGTSRWLRLVGPGADWPVVALGARAADAPTLLLGTVFGVWAPAPLDRFDDLLDGACPDNLRDLDRPQDGAWHFIAATVSPAGRGHGLGRKLLGAAARWVEGQGDTCLVRTLSPAVGLPSLAGVGPDDTAWPTAATGAIRSLATEGGKAALPILSLHLGAGAILDAILINSRADGTRSGRISLRFAYPRGDDARARQVERYRLWLTDRARCIKSGDAVPLSQRPLLWRLPDCGDERVFGSQARD